MSIPYKVNPLGISPYIYFSAPLSGAGTQEDPVTLSIDSTYFNFNNDDLSINTSVIALKSDLNSYLPLSGGTVSGYTSFTNSLYATRGVTAPSYYINSTAEYGFNTIQLTSYNSISTDRNDFVIRANGSDNNKQECIFVWDKTNTNTVSLYLGDHDNLNTSRLYVHAINNNSPINNLYLNLDTNKPIVCKGQLYVDLNQYSSTDENYIFKYNNTSITNAANFYVRHSNKTFDLLYNIEDNITPTIQVQFNQTAIRSKNVLIFDYGNSKTLTDSTLMFTSQRINDSDNNVFWYRENYIGTNSALFTRSVVLDKTNTKYAYIEHGFDSQNRPLLTWNGGTTIGELDREIATVGYVKSYVAARDAGARITPSQIINGIILENDNSTAELYIIPYQNDSASIQGLLTLSKDFLTTYNNSEYIITPVTTVYSLSSANLISTSYNGASNDSEDNSNILIRINPTEDGKLTLKIIKANNLADNTLYYFYINGLIKLISE